MDAADHGESCQLSGTRKTLVHYVMLVSARDTDAFSITELLYGSPMLARNPTAPRRMSQGASIVAGESQEDCAR